MKQLFDQVSIKCSRLTTKSYSTSFSAGIRFLSKRFRDPIYAVYGFVRFADEIVDTFHGYNKAELLEEFKRDTYKAIENRISLNPILNSFQKVVHAYDIDKELIDTFLKSMEMDLRKKDYNQAGYEEYILGSAKVVGLMCLKVFVERDKELYTQLTPYAKSLGSAFQKINFLRDLQADYQELGRTYFPGIVMDKFDDINKKAIEEDIAADFAHGFEGILKLPKSSRFGVYIAYVYFHKLFKKIKQVPSHAIMQERIRIPNHHKMSLLFSSYIRHSINLL